MLVERLSLTKAKELDLTRWHEFLSALRNTQTDVTIAVVGKYAKHKDA